MYYYLLNNFKATSFLNFFKLSTYHFSQCIVKIIIQFILWNKRFYDFRMWVIIWIYDTSMNCFHLDCVCVFVSMDYKWSLKSLQSLESYCEQLLNGLHPFLFDCSGAHLHTHTHAITSCSCRSENLIWPTTSRPVSLRPWGKRVGSLSHTLMHANRYWDMEENLNPGLHRCWARFRDNRTVTETHPFWPAALSVTLPASTFNHNCPFCSIYPNCSCLKNTAQNCLVLFLNEMQKLLSSEKNTLDHWAIVQFFFSLAQVRCFWRCFWFRSGLVAFSWRCLSVMTLDALTPASVHFLWWSPKCLNQLYLTVFSNLRSSLLLVYIFLPNFFLPVNLHLICFDTALLEQPSLSVMTLCDLPSLWRVSVIVFWTIAKSAVFPIIVLSKNKRYPEFIPPEYKLYFH